MQNTASQTLFLATHYISAVTGVINPLEIKGIIEWRNILQLDNMQTTNIS